MSVPCTTEELLTSQLRALGVTEGGVLMVHASLRALGRPTGGADTVLRALLAAVGPTGTLVVPSFTTDNSDSSPEFRKRVAGLDEAGVQRVRETMPPFDAGSTPAPLMGVLSETVRLSREALRSDHPQTSFAALGPYAEKIASAHRPDCHLGEDSPLARLYELDAQVLLLGTGYDRCTAFHLAEYRVPSAPYRNYSCVITEGGARTWWTYWDVVLDDSDFAALGADFEREVPGAVRAGQVGEAHCRLLGLPDAVDFAVRWMPTHRTP
ncbi:aminoglycoside N(3)-acetyltransferase [Streptomyces sp. NPDC050504]|uniref:aminoglycoside N(3)-acetyltransferase n=1 Tax=Streptomyces sp. NPDC050504 TaxID=3365618 RepID=UPI0037B21056